MVGHSPFLTLNMSTQPTDNLRVISYNSTGFNSQRADFICDIMEKIERENCVTAIQEHFIFEKNLGKIEKMLPNDLVVYSKGSFKDNSNILRGRGKGGLSFIWHKSIDHITSRIQVKNSSRVQCMTLDIPGCKLMLINTYLPQDTQTNNFDEQELLGCLAAVEQLLQANHHDQALVLGDLNCDFSRDTPFVQAVRNFCSIHHLKSVWKSFNIDYSYSSPCNTRFSVVDHFLCSQELLVNVVNAGVIHRGDNVSGHSPIFLELSTNHLPRRTIPKIQKLPKQNWGEASEEDKANYKSQLNEALQGIKPLEGCTDCENLNCNSERHKDGLDTYIIDIIEAIESSSKESIPYKNAPKDSQYKASHRKHIPGWKEHVKPYKDEANFWYLEWRAVGKPRSGLLYQNMRFFRNKFRYAKRRVLNAAECLMREKFLEALLEGDRNLNEELRKFKGVAEKVASKVDGHTDPDNISDHFKNIFQGLYNRTGSKEPLENLLNEVNESVEAQDIVDVRKITPELIQKIIKERIKPGKSDPEYDITTDNLKNAPFSLFIHLANFFRGILVHGSVNQTLHICAIILLLKDRS